MAKYQIFKYHKLFEQPFKEKNMKKLAFREHSGDWIYYLTSLSYKEVAQHVKKIDNELHTSKSLSDMIQRSLTDNVKKIATYIENQREHFFNALVLAVYDGDPQWQEINIDYGDGEHYELGILEFTGDEKIFPVDGQHRVEGIKLLLTKKENKHFETETIPVIFIGHKATPEGMQRTRRLFSTLNRYAKPVTLNDIIALDEDDIIAIATRHLIETHPLFKEKRLNNHKQKAIRDNDATAFTNIISLYECNIELLKYHIRNEIIKDENNRQLKGKSKIDTYCRFRKSDDEINSFLSFVDNFWNSVTNNITYIREYLEIDIDSLPAKQFRNQNGGILLFRPIGQKPFVINAVETYDKLGDFDIVMRRLNELNWDITSDLWTYIAWNPVNKKMIASSNGRVLYLMIKFLLNIVELSDKEKADLASQYKAFKKDEDSSDTEVFNILSKYSLQKI